MFHSVDDDKPLPWGASPLCRWRYIFSYMGG
jgi:hypothetical protein